MRMISRFRLRGSGAVVAGLKNLFATASVIWENVTCWAYAGEPAAEMTIATNANHVIRHAAGIRRLLILLSLSAIFSGSRLDPRRGCRLANHFRDGA